MSLVTYKIVSKSNVFCIVYHPQPFPAGLIGCFLVVGSAVSTMLVGPTIDCRNIIVVERREADGVIQLSSHQAGSKNISVEILSIFR